MTICWSTWLSGIHQSENHVCYSDSQMTSLMKTTWQQSELISGLKLSTVTREISNSKSGILPDKKDSEPLPILTTKVPMLLSSFTILPTWKLSKVFKTFGLIKSKVMLIQVLNLFLSETKPILLSQELFLSRKLNLLQNKKGWYFSKPLRKLHNTSMTLSWQLHQN